MVNQDDILKLLKKEKFLFCKDIIETLSDENCAGENIRIHLKQMRKFNEINFLLIKVYNKNEGLYELESNKFRKKKIIKQKKLFKDYPSVKIYLENGGRITRGSYMYFE